MENPTVLSIEQKFLELNIDVAIAQAQSYQCYKLGLQDKGQFEADYLRLQKMIPFTDDEGVETFLDIELDSDVNLQEGLEKILDLEAILDRQDYGHMGDVSFEIATLYYKRQLMTTNFRIAGYEV